MQLMSVHLAIEHKSTVPRWWSSIFCLWQHLLADDQFVDHDLQKLKYYIVLTNLKRLFNTDNTVISIGTYKNVK